MKIVLIITGSIAAYKSLDLIRRLQERGHELSVVMTKGAQAFITPMAVSALTGKPVYDDLWSLKDEVEMGHIRLSREHDVVLVAPASADFIAKMAEGRADDLASATLLASDKPCLIAPAMNVQMWQHPSTQRHLHQLHQQGITILGAEGSLACGETGAGRFTEIDLIIETLEGCIAPAPLPLRGRKALVTAGATIEPIDPVRFISNYSSGKQGYAIAAALAKAGATVTLVSGATSLDAPAGVVRVNVQTAQEMLEASVASLPADIGIFAAAVADWRVASPATEKLKKRSDASPPMLELTENPDILQSICQHPKRPSLVVGFAAETSNLLEQAEKKRLHKGCDWMIANLVNHGVFGSDDNEVIWLDEKTSESWPRASKHAIATRLSEKISHYFHTCNIAIGA